MVDLNGHEAGNGGYGQRKPKAHRVSSTRSSRKWSGPVCWPTSAEELIKNCWCATNIWRPRIGYCEPRSKAGATMPKHPNGFSVQPVAVAISRSENPANCRQRFWICRNSTVLVYLALVVDLVIDRT